MWILLKRTPVLLLLFCCLLSPHISESQKANQNDSSVNLEKMPIKTADSEGIGAQSPKERMELYEKQAFDRAIDEIEGKLLKKYGLIISVIVFFLTVFFLSYLYLIKRIATRGWKILKQKEKAVEGVEEAREKSIRAQEDTEKNLEIIETLKNELKNDRETINQLKGDMEKQKESAKKLEEEIKKAPSSPEETGYNQQMLFDRISQIEKNIMGQNATTEELFDHLKETHNLIAALGNIAGSINMDESKRAEIENINAGLKSGMQKLDSIKSISYLRKFTIDIFLPDGDTLIGDFKKSGYAASPYLTQPPGGEPDKKECQSICLGKDVPLEIAKDIIKRAREHSSFLNYIHLFGDDSNFYPVYARTHIFIGGDTRTAIEKFRCKPLTDEDFNKLLESKSSEEFHAFIRSFYSKKENDSSIGQDQT